MAENGLTRLARWLELAGSTPTLEIQDDASLVDDLRSSVWVLSPERAWYMKRRPKVYVFVALALALLLAAAALAAPRPTALERWWAWVLGALGAVVVMYSTFPYWAAWGAFRDRRTKSAALRAEMALRSLKSGDEIPVDALFVYTRRQLDAYQDAARQQQRVAFRHAQVASVLGLGVLLVGIAVSLRVGPGTEQYVAAGLAAVGGAISAYVTSTFFASARRADEELRHYYLEPHMMGRLVAVERIARAMAPGNLEEQASRLVDQALAWPLPGETSTAARSSAEERSSERSSESSPQ